VVASRNANRYSGVFAIARLFTLTTAFYVFHS
jgi:hypothetical protein